MIVLYYNSTIPKSMSGLFRHDLDQPKVVWVNYIGWSKSRWAFHRRRNNIKLNLLNCRIGPILLMLISFNKSVVNSGNCLAVY